MKEQKNQKKTQTSPFLCLYINLFLNCKFCRRDVVGPGVAGRTDSDGPGPKGAAAMAELYDHDHGPNCGCGH